MAIKQSNTEPLATHHFHAVAITGRLLEQMPADDRNDVEPIDDYIHQIHDDIKPEASMRNIKRAQD